VPVLADPLVNRFRHLERAGNPQQQSHRQKQRQAHPQKSETAHAPVDFPIRRNAMDGREPLFRGELRGGQRRARIGEWHRLHYTKPVKPLEKPYLKDAERAGVIV